MRLSIGWCALLSLVLTVPALAQTHPLRGPESSGVVPEPDQPVQPQTPTLEPRAPQQPAAQPPSPPQPPFTLTPQEEAQVDAVLKAWEERNRDIKTFDCEFTRWTYDVVFGLPNKPKFVDIGTIKYASPDRGMFRTEKTDKDGQLVAIENNRAEHWICDGRSIFEYNHTKKQVIEHQLPKELQGKAIADSPLPFLFGADANKLKQRYWIRIAPSANATDKVFLLAYPRFQQDAANFYLAEFIIVKDGMSPYALNLMQPNRKDRIAYQFFNIVVNDPLRLFKGDPFRASLPLGWQKIVEPAAGPVTQASRPSSESRR